MLYLLLKMRIIKVLNHCDFVKKWENKKFFNSISIAVLNRKCEIVWLLLLVMENCSCIKSGLPTFYKFNTRSNIQFIA